MGLSKYSDHFYTPPEPIKRLSAEEQARVFSKLDRLSDRLMFRPECEEERAWVGQLRIWVQSGRLRCEDVGRLRGLFEREGV